MPDGDSALIRGLRIPRHEAQLTQAIGQVAGADPRFASAFVRCVLGAASANAPHARAVAPLAADVPSELDCTAEHHLPGPDAGARGHGFVDLAFQGEPDFTLYVENKLHSGYGDEQVTRYLDAVEGLPPGRSGLVAITRGYPSYGEEAAVGRRGWLGSVRWRALLPNLRELKPVNDEVTRQWRWLLDVLEEQGDMGVIDPQPELIDAWAQYRRGRVDRLQRASGRAAAERDRPVRQHVPHAALHRPGRALERR